MADRHVLSTGSNTSPYDTWAKAATTIAAACTGSAAGDRILVSNAHTETTAGITMTLPGTASNPSQILSGTPDVTSGITALTAGAVIESSTTTLACTGSVYAYGLTFRITSASSCDMAMSRSTGNISTFESCTFAHSGAGASSVIIFGPSASDGSGRVILKSPSFKFAAAAQVVAINGEVIIQGGSVLSGGTSPTRLFRLNGDAKACNLVVEGFDFSNCGAGVDLCGLAGSGSVAVLRDCKVPASWTGKTAASAGYVAGSRVEAWNVGNSTAIKRLKIDHYHGTVADNEAIYRAGGATDDTTNISWKLDSSANTAFPNNPFRSPPLLVLNTTTGSSKTVTVNFVHDTNVTAGQGAGTSFAFRDNEVWMEVEYLGTSGEAIGSVSNTMPTVIATPADITSSSDTWTTTGLTTPVKQKLEATFTPQKKGYFRCVVCIGKPSKTIYLDPLAVVS